MAADSYEDIAVGKGDAIPALEVKPQDLIMQKVFGLVGYFVKMQKLLEFNIRSLQ